MVPTIGIEGQESRTAVNKCEDSVVYSIDAKAFPYVQISLVSVIRFRTAAGRWDMQVRP